MLTVYFRISASLNFLFRPFALFTPGDRIGIKGVGEVVLAFETLGKGLDFEWNYIKIGNGVRGGAGSGGFGLELEFINE